MKYKLNLLDLSGSIETGYENVVDGPVDDSAIWDYQCWLAGVLAVEPDELDGRIDIAMEEQK